MPHSYPPYQPNVVNSNMNVLNCRMGVLSFSGFYYRSYSKNFNCPHKFINMVIQEI